MRSRWLDALLACALAAFVGGCSGDTTPAPGADGAIPDGDVTADSGPVSGPDAAADAVAAVDATPDAAPVKPPQLGELTMLVNLGDSIAAGASVPNSYADLLMSNDDAAYPDFAGRDFAHKFPALTFVDKAKGGATSATVVGQASTVPANPAGNTLVVVSAGGNDLLNDATALLDAAKTQQIAQTIAANLKTALAAFADKAKFPGEVFVLALNVYEMTDGQGTLPDDAQVISACKQLQALGPVVGGTVLQSFDVFNTTLEAAYAQQGLLLIDVHQAFLGHGFNYDDSTNPHYHADDPTLWLQADCIHPNQAGHAGIRRLIWQRLFGE